jgi:hypothetical protein
MPGGGIGVAPGGGPGGNGGGGAPGGVATAPGGGPAGCSCEAPWSGPVAPGIGAPHVRQYGSSPAIVRPQLVQ